MRLLSAMVCVQSLVVVKSLLTYIEILGAAAVILTSYSVAKEMNLPVRAVIRGFADASQVGSPTTE